MQNKWGLKVVSASDQSLFQNDPLVGLNRMGLWDLVNHSENDEVILVLPEKDNKKLLEKLQYIDSQKMTRGGKTVRVMRAKVDPITDDVLMTKESLKNANLTIYSDDDVGTMVKLQLFQFTDKDAKLEIWKDFGEGGKLSQVCTYLSNLAGETMDERKIALFC